MDPNTRSRLLLIGLLLATLYFTLGNRHLTDGSDLAVRSKDDEIAHLKKKLDEARNELKQAELDLENSEAQRQALEHRSQRREKKVMMNSADATSITTKAPQKSSIRSNRGVTVLRSDGGTAVRHQPHASADASSDISDDDESSAIKVSRKRQHQNGDDQSDDKTAEEQKVKSRKGKGRSNEDDEPLAEGRPKNGRKSRFSAVSDDDNQEGSSSSPLPPPVTSATPADNKEEEPAPAGREQEQEEQHEEETNVEPEDPHEEDEKHFTHKIGPIPPLPNTAAIEEITLRIAFLKYNAKPLSKENIPVYGTTCIGEDCQYIKNQFQSLDTGIGHVVVVLNKDSDEWKEYFSSMEKLFPGRFSFFFRPQILGCAEGWNVILRTGFSIRPQPKFVMVMNGDLWALPTYLAQFAEYMDKTHKKVAANRFVHFSAFAVTRMGWKELGPFDEVIYPAYAEDVEYHIRAVSRGVDLGSFPKMRENKSHKHAGQSSWRNKDFLKKIGRWGKEAYIKDKWGVNMRMYTDFAKARPWKTPWNIKNLPHRTSYVVDPVHRECIKTGKGPKQGRDHCKYNTAAVDKLRALASGGGGGQKTDQAEGKRDAEPKKNVELDE